MQRTNAAGQVMIHAIAVMFFLPSVSRATTYYVTTGGSDANPGTLAAPWRTIQKAANTMIAGDIANVQAGTYNEQVSVKISGASGSPITFKASGTVEMQGFVSTANYIVIDGFNISNRFSETWTANGIYITGSYNIVENNYIHDLRYQGIRVGDNNDNANIHDNILRNNTIYKAAQSGISIGGRNHLVDHNDISHTIQYPTGGAVTSGADADGIRFFGSGHVIRNNKVSGMTCADTGNVDPHIDCFQTWGPAYNVVFERNLCDNPDPYTSGGCQPHGWMVSETTAPVSNLEIKNNVIRTQIGGIFINAEQSSIVNNTFKGRIILNDQSWAVGFQLRTSPNAKVQNNIFYDIGQNKHPYVDIDASSLVGSTIGYNCHYMSNALPPAGSPYPHDIWQQNPQLVNAAGSDLSLMSSSPLIDKGIALPAVLNDFLDRVRPHGNGYDIGAYEFAGTALLPPEAPTDLSLQTP